MNKIRTFQYTQDARANEVDSGTEPEEDEKEATGSAEMKGEAEKKEDRVREWWRQKQK